MSPANERASEDEESFVDVVADLPADAEPTEPVQQGQGLLDDPAHLAQAGAVCGRSRTSPLTNPGSGVRWQNVTLERTAREDDLSGR